ncbi:hypothetical protein BHE74_00032030 [Ensete ventricosum]|nr:hypothetical protein GW17_00009333 [Ensete ventricosum]RWW60941.1 hypothetical protein BHE74_00032030 [Ensete ventricosum]
MLRKIDLKLVGLVRIQRTRRPSHFNDPSLNPKRKRRRNGDRKGITKRIREEKEKEEEEDEPCAKERRSWSCFGGSGGERHRNKEKKANFLSFD